MNDLFDKENKEGITNKRFKAGETVFVHPEIRITEKFPYILKEMVALAGMPVNIERVVERGYRIKEDNNEFLWCDYCFMSHDEYAEYNSVTAVSEDVFNTLL